MSLRRLFMHHIMNGNFYLIKIFLQQPIHIRIIRLQFRAAVHPVMNSVCRFGIAVTVKERLYALGKVFLFIAHCIRLFPQPFPDCILTKCLQTLIKVWLHSHYTYRMNKVSELMNQDILTYIFILRQCQQILFSATG